MPRSGFVLFPDGMCTVTSSPERFVGGRIKRTEIMHDAQLKIDL